MAPPPITEKVGGGGGKPTTTEQPKVTESVWTNKLDKNYH